MNETEVANKLLTQRVIKAHWDSLNEDRRLRYIERILHTSPPISRQFDCARWWAERIVDFIDNGVIIGEEEL